MKPDAENKPYSQFRCSTKCGDNGDTNQKDAFQMFGNLARSHCIESKTQECSGLSVLNIVATIFDDGFPQAMKPVVK